MLHLEITVLVLHKHQVPSPVSQNELRLRDGDGGRIGLKDDTVDVNSSNNLSGKDVSQDESGRGKTAHIVSEGID